MSTDERQSFLHHMLTSISSGPRSRCNSIISSGFAVLYIHISTKQKCIKSEDSNGLENLRTPTPLPGSTNGIHHVREWLDTNSHQKESTETRWVRVRMKGEVVRTKFPRDAGILNVRHLKRERHNSEPRFEYQSHSGPFDAWIEIGRQLKRHCGGSRSNLSCGKVLNTATIQAEDVKHQTRDR